MPSELFEIYNNIFIFLEKYRNYEIKTIKLTMEKFNGNIRLDQYTKIESRDIKNEQSIISFLFAPNSMYVKTTKMFRSLLDGASRGKKSGDKKLIIQMFIREPISSYIEKRAVPLYDTYEIYFYYHRHFAIESPLAPNVPLHEILDTESAIDICKNHLHVHPLELPKILITDVQCIWIGAKLGDIIKLTGISPISGKYIKYRVVVPPDNLYDDEHETNVGSVEVHDNTETTGDVKDTKNIDIDKENKQHGKPVKKRGGMRDSKHSDIITDYTDISEHEQHIESGEDETDDATDFPKETKNTTQNGLNAKRPSISYADDGDITDETSESE